MNNLVSGTARRSRVDYCRLSNKAALPHAELGYQEFISSAYECEALEKCGFTISDRGVGGIDTSWIATWGSGSPVLGYLVEFDALPGLGNDTVPRQAPAKSGNTNGHGCGHNLIGTSSIGAAIRNAIVK